ncbi:MAG: ribosome recycling factor [Rhodobacteraceae bacterium]|nr:ribosome recycling factor [Paracoccaceae bacterium]MCY4250250.1 ribosome recycling factor [Paracoccaceae bacterium]MCY4308897.1 ribosome recycling factor [Paracoccaceae bacterium]
MEDFELDLEDFERRMDGAINSLRQDFAGLRTGRASASMVDSLVVNAYDAQMPMNQCGSINVPEPRLLSISVWDRTIVDNVVKAILDSGLGINPVVEGTVIRLPIPELNEERRKELSKVASQYAENTRISIRNIRKDGMDILKRAKSDGLSEDEVVLWSDEIQELTNQFIAKTDETLETKKSEIMAV